MIALMLNKLAAIIQSHAAQCDEVEVLYGHEVTELGREVKSAWVQVQTAKGQKRINSEYVVGCDWGKSLVRMVLFGKQAILACMGQEPRRTRYSSLPETADSNNSLHPENAWLAFRPDKEPNHWRLICCFKDSFEGQELDNVLKIILLGNVSLEQYDVMRARTYQIHQRIVDSMRIGRVLLASDAARLCCRYGALGLNGGIADVGSLRDCLVAIHEDKASETILCTCSEVRRDKWKNIIEPMSQNTLKIVFSDPANLADNNAYKTSQLMKTGPGAARARAPL
ncbi:Monooxygenase, FAD-binding protein [Beauveria brongniartii RCEF 3172]|uniref:Monooxygenase, FAD-binding protein n=1 Tax=Beauveria brongniartii RCEF 3172 TaxID=1081107 RepID=A0A162HU54_9HYPO|nr:Monooxygenase, FAD-binding protein [Beauveria brongniartii RCEF 3172]